MALSSCNWSQWFMAESSFGAKRLVHLVNHFLVCCSATLVAVPRPVAGYELLLDQWGGGAIRTANFCRRSIPGPDKSPGRRGRYGEL